MTDYLRWVSSPRLSGGQARPPQPHTLLSDALARLEDFPAAGHISAQRAVTFTFLSH